MRRCRVNPPNRCYHLISRITHRAYFLDGDIPRVVEKGDNVLAVRLLQLLQWEPKSPAYLRTTLGIASREYFTKAYLRPLVEAGLIERNDPDHPNSPQQKYAITKEGERRIGRVAPL